MKTIKTMLYNVLTFITQYEWHKIEDIKWRTLPNTHKNGKYGDYTYIKKAEGLVCIHPSHHRVYLFDDKRLDGNKMIRIPLFQSFSKYRIVGISTRDSYYKNGTHAIRCNCDRCAWTWHKPKDQEHLKAKDWKPSFGRGIVPTPEEKANSLQNIFDMVNNGNIKFVDTSKPNAIKDMFRDIKKDIDKQED